VSLRRSAALNRGVKPDAEAERIAARLNEGGAPVSLCIYCRHNRAGANTCEAFPEGIPEGFSTGWRLHLDPVEGDHGMQFSVADWVAEPIEDILRRVGPRDIVPREE